MTSSGSFSPSGGQKGQERSDAGRDRVVALIDNMWGLG